MSHWLISDFLNSAEAYARASGQWESLWHQVLRSSPPEHVWRFPWMNNPVRDGNPIFTAVCDALGRGVRIIQEKPGEPDDIDLDWWIDEFADPAQPGRVRELVIACCPTVENLARVELLLRDWVARGAVNGDDAGVPEKRAPEVCP